MQTMVQHSRLIIKRKVPTAVVDKLCIVLALIEVPIQIYLLVTPNTLYFGISE